MQRKYLILQAMYCCKKIISRAKNVKFIKTLIKLHQIIKYIQNLVLF